MDRPEGEGGIAGDHRPVERQLLQKLDNLDHFGTIGRHDERADGRLKRRRERMQHVHARARRVLAAAKPLAVEGDVTQTASRLTTTLTAGLASRPMTSARRGSCLASPTTTASGNSE